MDLKIGGSGDGQNYGVVQQGPGMGNIPNDYGGRTEDTYRDSSSVSDYDDFGGEDQNGQREDTDAEGACMVGLYSGRIS